MARNQNVYFIAIDKRIDLLLSMIQAFKILYLTTVGDHLLTLLLTMGDGKKKLASS